jgi:hypothetical protein
MAKIVSEAVVIEISRIAKDDEQLDTAINEEITTTIEQVVQQLVGDSVVVEVKNG